MNKVTITGLSTSDIPKLTSSEIDQYLREIKDGDRQKREEFIICNARLVLSVVKKFPNTRENTDDLFQVGVLGLIKAIDNFNLNLNVRFSTYAVPMIYGEIRRYVRENTTIKVGRNVRDIAYKTVKAREKLEYNSSRRASLMEIANEIDIPYREVVSALDAIAEPISIYESAYSEQEDGMMILDQIKDPKSDINDYIDKLTLKNEIKLLPVREKSVILMRYYKGRTQTEIADELQLSQAQVSRLEKNAIAKLKLAF